MRQAWFIPFLGEWPRMPLGTSPGPRADSRGCHPAGRTRGPRIIEDPLFPQEPAMPASRFVWYELMTADAPAATDFYTQVVGWRAQDSGMPGGVYTLMMTGDAQVAGLM